MKIAKTIINRLLEDDDDPDWKEVTDLTPDEDTYSNPVDWMALHLPAFGFERISSTAWQKYGLDKKVLAVKSTVPTKICLRMSESDGHGGWWLTKIEAIRPVLVKLYLMYWNML